MKILSDFHHGGLFAAQHYLLTRRLGHDLYRPIGLEWFARGYWDIARPYGNNIAIVRQFLAIDGSRVEAPADDGIHRVWDASHGYNQNAIELDAFRQMDFDLVIASVPDHIATYGKLIRDTGSRARLIFQLGNVGWHKIVPWRLVDNVMASVAPFACPRGKNVVFYRQEFDLQVFTPSKDQPEQLIASFTNCLPEPERFASLEAALRDWTFKSYGNACRDGFRQSIQEIASTMQRSRYGYHFKPHGDGYGHVLHNWLSVGKPVLVGCDDYQDKLAGELLEDMVTCIDMSRRSTAEIASLIRNMGESTYQAMCAAVQDRFGRTVDFDKDAADVQRFLEKSVS